MEKPQKRILTPFLTRHVPPIPTPEERKPHAEEKASFLSRLFFTWLIPLLNVGYKRSLEREDMAYLTSRLQVEPMTQRFYHHFHKLLEKAHHHHIVKQCKTRGETIDTSLVSTEKDLTNFNPRKVVIKGLFSTFKSQYLLACGYLFIAVLALLLNPLLVEQFIQFIQQLDSGIEGRDTGVGMAIGISVLVLIGGICQNHAFYHSMICGAQIRAVLMKVILDKSFNLSGESKKKYPYGKIMSLISGDTSKIDLALGPLPYIFVFPIPLIVSIGVLVENIGPSSLVGILFVIVLIGVITGITGALATYRKRVNVFTDKRVEYIQQVLKYLRIIKFYSWEAPYFNNIKEIRNKEMKILVFIQILRNLSAVLAVSVTTIASMAAFLVLYAVRGDLSPSGVFSSLSLFNVLTNVVFVLPRTFSSSLDAFVALGRIADYLCSEERVLQEKIAINNDMAVQMDHCWFKWDNDNDSVLSDINLSITKGSFTVITGTIGSGKSSLLLAIAGIMETSRGQVDVNGSLIFCGQPWIQNASVRDNITFGSKFDNIKYSKVISCCGLGPDLIEWRSDSIAIGDRGVTLSGGQKARINLARAVYSDSDIIVMDDVLSAVDTQIALQIVQECLFGFLKNKTRILATHDIFLISQADQVVFLNGDSTIVSGLMTELQSSCEGFGHIVEHDQSPTQQSKELLLQLTPEIPSLDDVSTSGPESRLDPFNQPESKAVSDSRSFVFLLYLQRGTGRIPFWLVITSLVISVVLSTFCFIFTNTWLSFWVENKFPSLLQGGYIGLYIVFAVLSLVFLMAEFVCIAVVVMRSSRTMNIESLKSLLYSPMNFIDVTPMGRILNRLTKDTDVLDNEMAQQIQFLVFPISAIIGIVVLCIIYLPYFAICIPIFLAVFVIICSYYQALSRDIKRLESLQRSFVYQNLNETFSGMDTIKSFNSQSRFQMQNNVCIDKMNECYYLAVAIQRWISVQTITINSVFILIIALLCVFRVFNISPASTGLILSYVLQISGQLNFLIRNLTNVENNMTSVERICEYAFNLLPESGYNEGINPEPSWPSKGAINFNNVTISYRPDLPLVLKNVTFSVKPGEKIGICGRTGAGKSSLISVLYRLMELDSGSVVIDGFDISTVLLSELRSRLSIIPQEPVLFSGTIRTNIDPFSTHSDETLQRALEQAGLTSSDNQVAPGNKFHLDTIVADEGNNYSSGEKQLISFARAIIKQSQILLLDEATSSVDYETDSNLQNTVVKEFHSRTILCIAHRLKTIINYDKILVLDKGEVREFDTPFNLYNNQDIFYEMCKSTGIEKHHLQGI